MTLIRKTNNSDNWIKMDKNTAFMKYYEPLHSQLNAYCFALCQNIDEAKDLMSHTVEIAYSKFDQLNDKSKFKFYLFGIASRLFNNERRKWEKRTYVDVSVLSSKSLNQYDSFDKADVYFLHKALKSLPPNSSEALLLFELEGFSIKEIAEIQNCNENTVKSRISRGRTQLKTILNPGINQE